LVRDYKTWQESSQKSIEKAFGILQAKFHALCFCFCHHYLHQG
jgi:hypothetical protein